MGFDEYIPERGVGWGEVLFMPTCLAYEVGGNVVLIFIGEKQALPIGYEERERGDVITGKDAS